MKVSKGNTFGNLFLVLIPETKEESWRIDKCLGSNVPVVIIGQVRVSDGYGDHYISLKASPNLSPDDLGRIVREAWIKWAKDQPNPKSTWLVPYDKLDETDKEADRMIGEAIVNAMRGNQ